MKDDDDDIEIINDITPNPTDTESVNLVVVSTDMTLKEKLLGEDDEG